MQSVQTEQAFSEDLKNMSELLGMKKVELNIRQEQTEPNRNQCKRQKE